MKKRYLMAILVLIAALLVSCTATSVEKDAAPAAEPTIAAPAVAEVPASTPTPAVAEVPAPTPALAVAEVPASTPVPETAATAPAAEPVATDTVVINAAPAISAADPDLDDKFSYAYGHLLAASVKDQGIKINASFFNRGASDFYNYVDPIISDADINLAFTEYQGYLDGTITEEQLVATTAEGTSDLPVSLLDRFSYGYGYLIMYNLQNEGILVSLGRYCDGIADSVAGIPLSYSDEEISAIFSAYQEKMYNEYSAAMAELAASNLSQAQAYLETNGKRAEVTTTASGLQYEVIIAGTGPQPTLENTVSLDYMITFLDGTTGDSSYSRGEPLVIPVSNLIPGFIEGLSLMPVGSQYRFFIHPSLAYGENGTETIAPNSLLIFDVELHEIKTPEATTAAPAEVVTL